MINKHYASKTTTNFFSSCLLTPTRSPHIGRGVTVQLKFAYITGFFTKHKPQPNIIITGIAWHPYRKRKKQTQNTITSLSA